MGVKQTGCDPNGPNKGNHTTRHPPSKKETTPNRGGGPRSHTKGGFCFSLPQTPFGTPIFARGRLKKRTPIWVCLVLNPQNPCPLVSTDKTHPTNRSSRTDSPSKSLSSRFPFKTIQRKTPGLPFTIQQKVGGSLTNRTDSRMPTASPVLGEPQTLPFYVTLKLPLNPKRPSLKRPPFEWTRSFPPAFRIPQKSDPL